MKPSRSTTQAGRGLLKALTLTAATLVAVAVMMVWPKPAAGELSNTPNPSTWVANDDVHCMVTDGATVYIGGKFTHVGPYTGGGVVIDSTTGRPQPSYPKVDGFVGAVASDGAGGWFIGGGFRKVGSISRNSLAHILPDGSVDASWNPDAKGVVFALVVSGSTVYIGGELYSIGGQSRRNIAALDASTGRVTSWDPDASGAVYALAVGDGRVYAGGSFAQIGGKLRYGIAALDASTGRATAWNPGESIDSSEFVAALAVDGGTIYAGGSFLSMGRKPRKHLAAIDASTGEVTSWNPDVGVVYSSDEYFGWSHVAVLAVDNGRVYAGGYFDVGHGLAAIDVSTGEVTSWNPAVDGSVSALAVSGGTVYVGGDFTSIGGQSRSNMAALDASTGEATSWNPDADNVVRSLAVSGEGSVYAGGEFISIGGQRRNHLAALDTTTGEPTSWNPDADYRVNALAVGDGTVYAGGEFEKVGGQWRMGIAAIDASTGEVTPWNPGANNYVDALAVSRGTVYAGGKFDRIGKQARRHIAAIDAVTGKVSAWNPNADSKVRVLAVDGHRVYAGGEFRKIGGKTRRHIAALDASTGEAISWNPRANLPVFALTVSGETVYVGGQFTSIGGQARMCIAALDASTGEATSWSPDANYLVYALAVAGDTVYAGGWFHRIGGQLRSSLAALDASTGEATSWNPEVSGGVYALAVSEGKVYSGGTLFQIGDCRWPHLAQFGSYNGGAYSITGRVVDGNGHDMPGVKLSMNIGYETLTGSDGSYAFNGLQEGSYTISSGDFGKHKLDPSSRTVNIGGHDISGQDFTCTLVGCLVVTVDPADADYYGAGWKITRDEDWREGTEWLFDIEVGDYTVSFKDIEGWITPSEQAITVKSGEAIRVAGLYTQVPVAAFTAAPIKGKAPFKVTFTDESEGEVNGRLWSFGDGSFSMESNPTHVYKEPGSYSVKLTVEGPGGRDTEARSRYIRVNK